MRQRATRASAVADALQDLIRRGELAPGTRLRQAEIARRFGVSTTPVREAFTSLARQGLVRRDVNRGVEVVAPSPEDVRENFEIRGALERLATTLAAAATSPAVLDELDAATSELRSVTDPERYEELDRAWHAKLYEGVARPALKRLIEGLWDTAAIHRAVHGPQRVAASTAERDVAEHRAIVAALRAGAGETAGRLMSEHIAHGAEDVTGAPRR